LNHRDAEREEIERLDDHLNQAHAEAADRIGHRAPAEDASKLIAPAPSGITKSDGWRSSSGSP